MQITTVVSCCVQPQVEQSKQFMENVVCAMFKGSQASVKTQVIQIGTGGSENIGTAICHQAEVLDAAFIIMASRSKSVVARFFLGSVAEYVVRHSLLPVTVVH